MATLQNLRNKGPLLVIFVGIALLAFVVGDALKLFDSNSIDTSVGKVGEEEVTNQEYSELYTLVENYYKLSGVEVSGTDVRNETWGILTQEKQFFGLAEELGLDVTAEEINYVLTNKPELHQLIIPNAQNCPFVANGAFNMNLLTQILNAYEEEKSAGQHTEQTIAFYDYWKYLERQIKLRLTLHKLAMVYSTTTIANPAVTQKNFELGNDTITAEVAYFPFVTDAAAPSEEEIAAYYNDNKRFRTDWQNFQETRDIKYVTYKVTPSAEDSENTRLAMQQCADTLKSGYDNYDRVVRITRSERVGVNNALATPGEFYAGFNQQGQPVPLNSLVTRRIELAGEGEIIEPFKVVEFENGSNKEYFYVIKNLKKQYIPKEFTLNYAVITHESEETLNSNVDSLVTELNKGGNFAELTKDYETKFDSVKFETERMFDYIINASNETAAQANFSSVLMNDTIQSKILMNNSKDYQVVNIAPNARIVYRMLEKNDSVLAYNPLIMRREVKFSDKTYNKEYDEFCKFVADCKSIAELEAKAKENPKYSVRPFAGVNTLTTNIGAVKESAELIKWIFNENTALGSVSEIHRCGENDQFMIVALENINHKGYKTLAQKEMNGMTLYDAIKNEIMDEKAAEKTISNVKSMDKSKVMANAVTVDQLNFNMPAYVFGNSEPLVSAVAAKLEAGETSEPFKGNNGVYVVKVLSKKSTNGTLDMKIESAKANQFADPNSIFNTLFKNNPAESNFHKH